MNAYRTVFGTTLLGVILLTSARGADSGKKAIVDIPISPIDPAAAAKVSFARQIKPILINHCVECHSAEERSGRFEVTSVATLQQKGKKAGPGVVPGKPDESAIIQYVRGQRKPQMPKGGQPLSPEELHALRLWISAGAVDDSKEAAQELNQQATRDTAAQLELLRRNKDAQALVAELLYARNPEERFRIGRKLRLALLPPGPQPPAFSTPSANPIDRFIVDRWNQAPSPVAGWKPELSDDAAFVRRVHLDIIGIIPSEAIAQSFIADTAPDKRTRLIDQLLARNEDYAAHWTPFWEDALGSDSAISGLPANGNQQQRIFNNFVANKPYDLMVAELIDPTLPEHKKAVAYNSEGVEFGSIGYIRTDTHKETLQTAANVAQVFLGTSMKCASCHSHFLNKEWPQARFLAFAGLFAAKDLELIRCEKGSGQTIAAAFPFPLPGVPDRAPVNQEERLHHLAQMLVDPHNPRFAKTIVNRLWKRYLGLGLFEPADDFRLDRLPSHPALLDWLADDFMRHEFDLKHTIRLILTSHTYQMKYDPAVEDAFDIEDPSQPRFFRSPSLRRLTAEQLIDSVRFLSATNQDTSKRAYRRNQSTALTRALGRPDTRREISTYRPDAIAVVQSLELLNGPEFHKMIYQAEWIRQLNDNDAPPAPTAIVRKLYQTVLSRPPDTGEIDAGTRYLQHSTLPESLPDMLWALVVSPEFQYIR
jgi:hypothetical protein